MTRWVPGTNPSILEQKRKNAYSGDDVCGGVSDLFTDYYKVDIRVHGTHLSTLEEKGTGFDEEGAERVNDWLSLLEQEGLTIN